MRASLKSTLAATLAALSLTASVAAADAHPFWPHGQWHHGFGWGPAFAFGVFGGAIATDSCLRYRPVYDAYGNYVGRHLINVCY